MTWTKLDDGFWSNPKIAAAGNEAAGVYVRALTWCAAHSGEPRIPAAAMMVLARRRAVVECLVAAELATEDGDSYRLTLDRRLCLGFAAERQPIPRGVRKVVLTRDGMVCGLCGHPIEDETELHIDHIRPVARGGTNDAANLQPAHAGCNLAKGAG